MELKDCRAREPETASRSSVNQERGSTMNYGMVQECEKLTTFMAATIGSPAESLQGRDDTLRKLYLEELRCFQNRPWRSGYKPQKETVLLTEGCIIEQKMRRAIGIKSTESEVSPNSEFSLLDVYEEMLT